MTHDKNLGISSRVFRDISFASVGVAVAGLGVVLAAERKQKKEFNEELEETKIGRASWRERVSDVV